MNHVTILILIFLTFTVNAQVNNPSSVDVIFTGNSGEGIDTNYDQCNGSGLCIGNTINPENNESCQDNNGNSEMRARFFMNENNTLFLALKKQSVPLKVLIDFFYNNNFKIRNQYHLPQFVIDKLNIDNSHKIIPGGIYPIFEGKDKTEIIINFGSLHPVLKKEEIKKNTEITPNQYITIKPKPNN